MLLEIVSFTVLCTIAAGSESNSLILAGAKEDCNTACQREFGTKCDFTDFDIGDDDFMKEVLTMVVEDDCKKVKFPNKKAVARKAFHPILKKKKKCKIIGWKKGETAPTCDSKPKRRGRRICQCQSPDGSTDSPVGPEERGEQTDGADTEEPVEQTDGPDTDEPDTDGPDPNPGKKGPEPTGGGGGGKCGGADLASILAKELAKTNELRAKHGADPLEADPKLDALAQKWADKIAASGKFEHNPDRSKDFKPEYIGENIYMSWASDRANYEAGTASVNWYSEVDDYDFQKHDAKQPGKVVGHFTQLVWKGTKRVGHGVGYSKDCKSVYVVGNYGPGGNSGDPASNVLPAKSQ